MSKFVSPSVLLPALVLCLLFPHLAQAQAGCEYSSQALPDSVVPPLAGASSARLSMFDDRGSCDVPGPLTFYITYHNLDSEAIGASIHRGTVGQNGEQVLSLVEGAFEAPIEGTTKLDPALCWEIFANQGALYFVVQTTNHPKGAVRGQVRCECWSAAIPTTWSRVRGLFR